MGNPRNWIFRSEAENVCVCVKGERLHNCLKNQLSIVCGHGEADPKGMVPLSPCTLRAHLVPSLIFMHRGLVGQSPAEKAHGHPVGVRRRARFCFLFVVCLFDFILSFAFLHEALL